METEMKSNDNGLSSYFAATLPLNVGKQTSAKDNAKVKHKKCRPFGNLDSSTIIVHNKGTHYSVNLNSDISSKAYIKSFQSVCIAHDSLNNICLVLSKEAPDRKNNKAKISFNTHVANISATFSNKYIVREICRQFKLGRGDFALRIQECQGNWSDNNEQIMIVQLFKCQQEKHERTMVCPNCGRDLPASMFVVEGNSKYKIKLCIDCYREYCKNRESGSKKENYQESTPTKPPTPASFLAMYTDKELYEELKRRGWSGKLTKNDTLE